MNEPLLFEALIVHPFWRVVVIALAYTITIGLSGPVVRYFVTIPNSNNESDKNSIATSGSIIGKCENIITITFVLMRAETGLALIFAAKSLVRSEKIAGTATDASYYLGGTLVNFAWSLLVAVIARVLVMGI